MAAKDQDKVYADLARIAKALERIADSLDDVALAAGRVQGVR